MELLKEYLLQNWALVLVLMAFTIMLMITVFFRKKTIRRLYILIIFVFLATKKGIEMLSIPFQKSAHLLKIFCCVFRRSRGLFLVQSVK